MVTIYELLEVEEDASKEEIERAYSRLVLEFRQDINFDDETNKENEMIVNKLRLAYEILIDDEKRKKYDYQLAQQRAENLLQNVSVRQDEPIDEIKPPINDVKRSTSQNQQKDEHNIKMNYNRKSINKVAKNVDDIESDMLTKDEKKQIREAAQNEFEKKLKKAKQAEEEYVDAYNKAYSDYLRKNGYAVKEPWTFRKVKSIVIAVFVVILTCFIMWHIPPIQNMLIGLYEENIVIKILVDIVKSIVDAIIK